MVKKNNFITFTPEAFKAEPRNKVIIFFSNIYHKRSALPVGMHVLSVCQVPVNLYC
jgi:hypothetical protein